MQPSWTGIAITRSTDAVFNILSGIDRSVSREQFASSDLVVRGRARTCLDKLSLEPADDLCWAVDIALYPPMLPNRPCRFCLSLQRGSVFADFDVDSDGRVFAVRISFDGYGCCRAPADVGRMSVRDSEALLAMVQQGSIDAAAALPLRAYFQQNRDAFWSDALAHHGLL